MLRGIYGDPERYGPDVLEPSRGDIYFPATARARRPTATTGILGRVDDVVNVSGHRIGTMEVESALVEPPGRGGGRCRRQARPRVSKDEAIVAIRQSLAPGSTT